MIIDWICRAVLNDWIPFTVSETAAESGEGSGGGVGVGGEWGREGSIGLPNTLRIILVVTSQSLDIDSLFPRPPGISVFSRHVTFYRVMPLIAVGFPHKDGTLISASTVPHSMQSSSNNSFSILRLETVTRPDFQTNSLCPEHAQTGRKWTGNEGQLSALAHLKSTLKELTPVALLDNSGAWEGSLD